MDLKVARRHIREKTKFVLNQQISTDVKIFKKGTVAYFKDVDDVNMDILLGFKCDDIQFNEIVIGLSVVDLYFDVVTQVEDGYEEIEF